MISQMKKVTCERLAGDLAWRIRDQEREKEELHDTISRLHHDKDLGEMWLLEITRSADIRVVI